MGAKVKEKNMGSGRVVRASTFLLVHPRDAYFLKQSVP
jgi:hypothetical protein